MIQDKKNRALVNFPSYQVSTVTIPETCEEEVDVLFGLEPKLGERGDDFNVDWRVGGAVQGHSLQQILVSISHTSIMYR